jgi:hypothetical protein
VTATLPFGKTCHCVQGTGRSISLGDADDGIMLHAMIHQILNERREDAKHMGPGWRREIMRLHGDITGTDIWAGRSTTIRRAVEGYAVKRMVRINAPDRATGAVSLMQAEIARWPHSAGIDLGALGT